MMSDRVSTLVTVARTLVDAGVYDAQEISHLLAQHVDCIVRWSVPDGKGRAAIVAPSLDRAFSFVDLVSLAVVAELWQRHVSEADMRNGVAMLMQETGYDKPFAHQQVIEMLATCGTSLLANLRGGWFDIGRGGQGAFEEIIRLYFRAVAYDDLGVAQLWRPAPFVLLDPRIQAGTPCIEGTRIPTEIVASMLHADSAETVGEELDLTIEQVQAAADFEAALAERRGLAA
jgi:uncharacterized protein (DUF433 family)